MIVKQIVRRSMKSVYSNVETTVIALYSAKKIKATVKAHVRLLDAIFFI